MEQVQTLLPGISFVPGTAFCWSPRTQKITYIDEALAHDDGAWALLHEAGHALLSHQIFTTDFELLAMEVAAWEKAKELGKDLGITIEGEHIQDCLDTYRDWLHRRSLCPTCGSVSLQRPDTSYACHNCPAAWSVTSARFCRPYRRLSNSHKQTPKPAAAIFQQKLSN